MTTPTSRHSECSNLILVDVPASARRYVPDDLSPDQFIAWCEEAEANGLFAQLRREEALI